MDANGTVLGGAPPSYALALWNLIIRPPRAQYHAKALGPKVFPLHDGLQACRQDFPLKTPRGVHLECSCFRPEELGSMGTQRLPVVVYLHGNSSCRLEVLEILHPLLLRRFAVFCYDAAGCGHSEGEYVSLGWNERDDLAFVIEHLRAQPWCGPVAVWGRSMGAVTALMHAHRDPSIGAICADSAFASLPQLMWELGSGDHFLVPLRVPSWLLSGAVAFVRMRVQSLAGFDVEDVVPLRHASSCHVPTFFIHGEDDKFVRPSHSKRLFDAYAGDKEFIRIRGDHNSRRGITVINRTLDFLCRALRCGQSRELDTPPGFGPCHVTPLPVVFWPSTADDALPLIVPPTPRPVPSTSVAHARPSDKENVVPRLNLGNVPSSCDDSFDEEASLAHDYEVPSEFCPLPPKVDVPRRRRDGVAKREKMGFLGPPTIGNLASPGKLAGDGRQERLGALPTPVQSLREQLPQRSPCKANKVEDERFAAVERAIRVTSAEEALELLRGLEEEHLMPRDGKKVPTLDTGLFSQCCFPENSDGDYDLISSLEEIESRWSAEVVQVQPTTRPQRFRPEISESPSAWASPSKPSQAIFTMGSPQPGILAVAV